MNIRSKVKVTVRVRVRRSSGRRELCTSVECFSSSDLKYFFLQIKNNDIKLNYIYFMVFNFDSLGKGA